MVLSPLLPSPPHSLKALLEKRDWNGLAQVLDHGFPANAAWLGHGTLFELFAVAASVPIPEQGTRKHQEQLNVVNRFLAAGLANRAPFGQDSPFSLPLTVSALLGRADFLRALMAGGHSPDLPELPGHQTPLSVLCMAGADHSTANLPGRANRLAILDTLVQGGANIEHAPVGHYRPLQLAAMSRDLDLIAGLLRHGAIVDARTAALDFGPGPHWSPLAWSVYLDDAYGTSALLEAGADPTGPMNPGLSIIECAGRHASPDTWRALFEKVSPTHPEVIRGWFQAIQANRPTVLGWFLATGFDTNALSESGANALEVAASAQATDAFLWLVGIGFSPHEPGLNGLTPLQRLDPSSKAHVSKHLGIAVGPRLAWTSPAEPSP